MPRKFKFFAALLVLLIAAAGWQALAGSTQTGTIKGQVVDQKGEPLPGVVLTLRSEAMIRERTTQTDAEGYFFAPALPVGQYRVVATMQGYQTTAVITEVQIDKTTPLKLTMREGEMTEQITVTGAKPVVSKTQTEGAKIVSKKETNNIPVARSYQSLMQFAPGVSGSSNPNMLGGTSNSNQYLTDGVSIRDPVTGTFGSNMVFDAIEAVDIKTTGVSAEYGQFQGGVTNMITKSGGNTLTGSFRDVVSQPNWRSNWKLSTKKYFYRDINIPGRPSTAGRRSNALNTTLGGPIVTDRAWFFLAYEKQSTTGSGLLASNRYYETFYDGDNSLLKATYQVTPEHTLRYFYQRDPADTSRCYFANFWGGLCYNESAVDVQTQGGAMWTASWSGIWGPNLVSDLKVARFQNEFLINDLDAPYNWESADQMGPARYPGGPLQPAPFVDLRTGNGFDTHVFSSDPETRKRKQYEAMVTWFLDSKSWGTHTLKIGADYYQQDVVGSSIIKGDALIYGYIDGDVPGTDPFVRSNRVYLAKQVFAPPSDAGPTNKMKVLFVNDDWQLNQNLAFNLGLRYEKNLNENDKGEEVISDDAFAPRFGVTYDVTGKGVHLVKGTYSQYLAGINLTTLSAFVRAAGGQSAYINYRNRDRRPGMIDWYPVSEVSPDPSTNTWQKDLKPQRIDEWTLGYEWSPIPEMGIGLKYVDRVWNDITTVRYRVVDGLKYTHIFNNSEAKRDYKAWILTFDKRFSNNWMVSGSYTRSESKGNVTSDAGFDSFQSWDIPETEGNRFGYLPWDVKDAVKVYGYYALPLRSERHSFTIGATFNYASGPVYAKNRTATDVPGYEGERIPVFYEPRGCRRVPGTWSPDLSFNYGFKFNKRVQFEFRSDIFNFLDIQKPINLYSDWQPDTSNARFGHATAYGTDFQTPRTFRFQFALNW